MNGHVFLPAGLEAAIALRVQHPKALVYCGGTDLLVRLRQMPGARPDLICLERVGELLEVSEEGGRIFMGAGVTHARLLENPLVTERLPLLAKALGELGSPPIRNMGTIGGNVATASPAGDCLPPLYCLDASVLLASQKGCRKMPVQQFITGPGQTDLRPGELIWGVEVIPPSGHEIHHFEKVGQRRALAISVVSLAARIQLSAGDEVQAVRLAWGSVGPTVVTCPPAEQALMGGPLCVEALKKAANLFRKAVRPITDVRASADYRRQTAGNLLLRLALYRQARGPC